MHIEQQLDVQPSHSTVDVMQLKQERQSVRDEGMLGPETVRRHPGEPTSKLAADSTLSPKVNMTDYLFILHCLVCPLMLQLKGVQPIERVPQKFLKFILCVYMLVS